MTALGRPYRTISFVSDYGLADEFVGVVHSVIRSICPDVGVIDICHEIPAHDVRAGSLTLVRAAQYLAPGVVLAVVDPGVGSDRRAVAVEVADGEAIFVGPDNGLLAPAVSMVGGAGRAVELTAEAYQLPAPGPTFAGRDVFAPGAAYLALGVDLAELGPAIDPLGLRPGLVPLPRVEDGVLHVEVLWVDHFGNVQLNVSPDEVDDMGDRVAVRWGESVRTAARVDTFDAIGPGQLGLLIDSYGLMALAVNRASAGDEMGLRAGDLVSLQSPES